MNRTLLFISAICLLCFSAKAQVNIIQYPLTGLEFKTTDIFKADIQNAGQSTYRVVISGSVVNSANGQKVLTAQSTVVDCTPGFKSLNEAALAPQYRFYSSVAEQTGSLPYGSYEVCIKVVQVSGSQEELASACQSLELSPMSPPILVNPEHESTVYEKRPLLVWLPPMPVNKNKVLYDLKLVEILQNQTAYDAVQRNFSIIEKQGIKGTTLQYPANAIALEPLKRYAWQVSAKTEDRKPIGETEIWWFTVADDKDKDTTKKEIPYGLLQKNPDNGYLTINDNKLYFQFDERYNENVLTFKIMNKNGVEVGNDCGLSLSKQTGINKFLLDLSTCNDIRNGMHILKVTNEKNEVYQLRFIIKS